MLKFTFSTSVISYWIRLQMRSPPWFEALWVHHVEGCRAVRVPFGAAHAGVADRPPGHFRISHQAGRAQAEPSQNRRRHADTALWIGRQSHIHLHCLVLDGVYRTTEGLPVFQAVRAPTAEELQVLLTRIIKRLMKFLTRKGYLIEEQGMTYLGDTGPETALGPLQQAACTYRIALGPRAGQKVLTFQTISTREPPLTPVHCVDAQGFSLHAEVCCAAHERHKGNIYAVISPAPAIANERLTRNRAGDVVLQLKSPYHDGTTHIVMSPLELMQRLAALVPRPRLHLIRFPGVLASHAKLRPEIIPSSARQAGHIPVPGFPSLPVNTNTPSAAPAEASPAAAPVPMSWARLLKRVFEIDIEHCPQCGGTLKIIAAIEHPIPGRGLVCLTAHEPSSTVPLDEKGRLKFLFRELPAFLRNPRSVSRRVQARIRPASSTYRIAAARRGHHV
jgi:Putative transposase